MKKHTLFLLGIILFPLFDLWTTYKGTGGVFTSENELNPMVKFFDLNFRGFIAIVMIEVIVLILLYYFLMMMKSEEKPTYKLLTNHKRKYPSHKFEIRKAAPLFFYIIILVHFFAGINNLFIYFYQQNPNGPNPLVDFYIRSVHLSGRSYSLYLVNFIIAVAVYYLVDNREKKRSESAT